MMAFGRGRAAIGIGALAAITGVLVGTLVQKQPASKLGARVMDRRCRGGCMSSAVSAPAALLSILPIGFSSSLIASNVLTSVSGSPVTNANPSPKYCNNGNGVTYLGSRQNLFLQSQALATSPWNLANIGTGASVTNNTTDVVAPDGTSTATKFVTADTTPGHVLFSIIRQSSSNGTWPTVTVSCWMRTLSGTATRYISNAAIAPYSGQACSISPTWSRCVFVQPSPGNNPTFDIGSNTNSQGQSGGQPAATVYLWGCQAEPGGSATPYMATTSTNTATATGSVCVESNGLVFETSSTNLLLQSQATATTPWGATVNNAGSLVVTNNTMDVAAPDGTHTATKYVEASITANGDFAVNRQNLSYPAGATTGSMYVRGAASGQTYLRMSDGAGHSAYQTCPFTASSWTRCILTLTTAAAFGILDSGGTDLNNPGQTGTPAQTFYVWGVQLENQAFASSYISTTTSGAARAFDNITVTNPLATNAPTWCAGATATLFANTGAFYLFGMGTNGLANSWNVYAQGKTALSTNDAANAAQSATSALGTVAGTHRSIVTDSSGTLTATFDALTTATTLGTGTGVVVQGSTIELGGINGNYNGASGHLSNIIVDSSLTGCN